MQNIPILLSLSKKSNFHIFEQSGLSMERSASFLG
jgi:hypothetical protein